MIPYYGKHGTKQFIRGKPIRFGFKLWCLTSTEGYLFHAEPYCGSDTKLKDTGLGQCADAVLGLIEKSNLSSGCTLTFDNLFPSLPLLDELSKRGIGGLGTLRQNRLENTPVPTKQLMKKTIRGSYQGATDNHGNTVVVWHDTAVVTCASNYAEALPESFVKRWSKTKKKKADIAIPNTHLLYNQQMGGVDLFDKFVATYRARIRSKRWWWPFFAWSLNAAAVNAWLLHKKIEGKNVPMLAFMREIVLTMLSSSGRKKISRLQYPRNVLENIRVDSINHVIIKGKLKYTRCKVCKRRSVFECHKCHVTLHPASCFKHYHESSFSTK